MFQTLVKRGEKGEKKNSLLASCGIDDHMYGVLQREARGDLRYLQCLIYLYALARAGA